MTGKPLMWPGGRTAGLARLQSYDPTHYSKSRNFLDAPVSRLSPYLRHGMISAIEVREHFRERFASQPEQIEEWLRQLAWRDFFEKVLEWHGEGLHEDVELPKHHVERSPTLPDDIQNGRTGLPCIDGMLGSLFDTGYLHNHERLWFAAYLCHFRGVSWKVGAKLFREHLLDGDVASNSSSWQWLESTFASKPYFMNKENIAKFSRNRWCDGCTAECPFDATYEQLQNRLFGGTKAPLAGTDQPASVSRLSLPIVSDDEISLPAEARSIVWVHDAAMSSVDPAIILNPDAVLLFVLDSSEPWAQHRYRFVREGWVDVINNTPNRHHAIYIGDPANEIRKAAEMLNTKSIHVSDHPNPSVRRTILDLETDFDVTNHPRPVFAEYSVEPKRFSRYWQSVATSVLGYRPKSSVHQLHKTKKTGS